MTHVRTTTARRTPALAALLFAILTASALIGCGRSEPAAKAYPLDVCIVSAEKLGSMGEPIAYVHDGQEVKFCCKGCQSEFKKDPNKYLAKLEGKQIKAPDGDDQDHSGHDH